MRPLAAGGVFERLGNQGTKNGYVEMDPSRRYGRFDEVLGKGAMKTVYRAFDEVNGTEVAWNQAKICDVMRSPEALQRMYSEVHLLSSLSHPSIISFHDSWVDPANYRTFNFITEMFTSGTLREYRQKYKRVDIRAVKSWARQILEGLVYLHSHNPPVIHRDLKCDNIFVNGHLGQVKIGDLGLAAMLRGAQSAHSVIGTPEFMAPEVYEEEYDELVDIYSFGMCLLEMLTSEYPYSECSNPAQIYKKVTAGKLPDAFQRIRDPQARHFIGRCLEKVSRRSSAEELLLDPFLAFHDQDHRRRCPAAPPRSCLNTDHPPARDDLDALDIASSAADGAVRLHHPPSLPSLQVPCADDADPAHKSPAQTTSTTEMTITGKMTPEDDNTVFLKVQIADQQGKTSNIYFPFDTVGDTPIDVANEMVKELDIRDLEASEIAEMIAQEISSLVPGWEVRTHHAYNYVEDEQDRSNHPFCCLPSPTSSSSSCHDGSAPLLFGVGMTSSRGQGVPHSPVSRWLGDGLFQDDDDISSVQSSKYSSVHYTSGSEQEMDGSLYEEEEPTALLLPRGSKLAKICTYDEGDSIGDEFRRKCSTEIVEHPSGNKRAVDHRHRRRLMRNQSMMDLRSQLLHRALVEELNKRMFKTIGSVENIGFQVPCASNSREGSYYRKKRTKDLHGR